jgi:hypothetical protein
VIRCSGFVPSPSFFAPVGGGALVFDRRGRQGQAARLAEKVFYEFAGWGVPANSCAKKSFSIAA